MRVLLSIKPEFAQKIFDGSKKFEFRKAIFKNKEVKTVVVYASSPVKKVIGEFEIETIISCRPDILWNITKDQAGINEEFFYQYFENRERGFAIEIKNPIIYEHALSLKDDFNLTPPQSFLYLS